MDAIEYKEKQFVRRPDNENSWSAATGYLTKHENENLELTIRHLGALRTHDQNSSIHLYCTWLAKAFTDAGIYRQRKLFGQAVEMPWTCNAVKVDIWHPVQYAMFPDAIKKDGEPSTAKLNTKQVGQVYEIISANVAHSKGINVPFPDKFGQAFR